jgi:hypothetical protein
MLATACTETTEGFLDSKGKESDDLETVFQDSVKVVKFNASLYWQLGRLAQAPHSNASSFLQDMKDFEEATDNSRHVYFSFSEFTPAFTEANFTQDGGNANFGCFRISWTECFQSIFRCNTFLENYERAPLSQTKKEEMASEARFLRAYYFLHLLKEYGGLPLVTESIEPFDPARYKRSTFEECVNWLAEQFEEAVEVLPLVEDGADYGRPTKASALGALTELWITAASPLYNEGNIGKQLGASAEQISMVGYETSHAKENWEKAADAAKRLMDLGTHRLITNEVANENNPTQPDNRPGYGFYVATTTRKNDERIWFWITTNYPWPARHLLPKSRNAGAPRNMPYHELTEAFPMKNGKGIKEDGSGYDNDNPYANRDPRFDFTIIHNESSWIKAAGGEQEPIYTYRNASQDGYGVSGGTSTGYYYRKGCPEDRIVTGTGGGDGQGVSFIRYASIMLWYAEALTELDVNANRDEIEKQLFAIRDRAGIDKGSDGRYGIKANMGRDEMIDFIVNERRIEFADEAGDRFWTLKRRRLYEKLNNVMTSAAVWDRAKNGEYTWQIMPIQIHRFTTRMYFFAVPQREINASHGELIQNPGW